MLSEWISRLERLSHKCSPSGEIMHQCMRRKVQLTACEDGSINMRGKPADVDVLSPLVEEHAREIRMKLNEFQDAIPPATLRALH